MYIPSPLASFSSWPPAFSSADEILRTAFVQLSETNDFTMWRSHGFCSAGRDWILAHKPTSRVASSRFSIPVTIFSPVCVSLLRNKGLTRISLLYVKLPALQNMPYVSELKLRQPKRIPILMTVTALMSMSVYKSHPLRDTLQRWAHCARHGSGIKSQAAQLHNASPHLPVKQILSLLFIHPDLSMMQHFPKSTIAVCTLLVVSIQVVFAQTQNKCAIQFFASGVNGKKIDGHIVYPPITQPSLQQLQSSFSATFVNGRAMHTFYIGTSGFPVAFSKISFWARATDRKCDYSVAREIGYPQATAPGTGRCFDLYIKCRNEHTFVAMKVYVDLWCTFPGNTAPQKMSYLSFFDEC